MWRLSTCGPDTTDSKSGCAVSSAAAGEADRTREPLVSIGVPVYNGEAGLARALDSLLNQDYANLEIIISDNGSTDATPLISQAYAARDSRVRVYRSASNMGMSWNFNRVFELAHGKYFMWAAHDDDRDPSFVSACVARLEASPSAVLCQAHTAMYIQGRPELLSINNLDSFQGVTSTVARYRQTLSRFPATAFYGVYRRSAMKKTRVFQKHVASDIAFVQELSMYGDFVQVPRVLFSYHCRPTWNTIQQDYRTIYGKDKPFYYLPFAVLFWSHWKRIAASLTPATTKLRLWGVLTVHQVKQLAIKILIKVTGRLCPERWRERLALAIYARFIHSSNVRVECKHLFVERAVKPTLGWWARG